MRLSAVAVSVPAAVVSVPYWRPAAAVTYVAAAAGKLVMSPAVPSSVVNRVSTSTTSTATALAHVGRDIRVAVRPTHASTVSRRRGEVVGPVSAIVAITIAAAVSVSVPVTIPVTVSIAGVWRPVATVYRWVVSWRRWPWREAVRLLVACPGWPAAVVTTTTATATATGACNTTTRPSVLRMSTTTAARAAAVRSTAMPAEAVALKVAAVGAITAFRMATPHRAPLRGRGQCCFAIVKLPAVQLVRLLKHRDVAWLRR